MIEKEVERQVRIFFTEIPQGILKEKNPEFRSPISW